MNAPQAKNGKRGWTEEEDAIIRAMHGKNTYAEIAEAVKRPRGSIGVRITQLGLSKKQEREVESRIGTIIRPRPGVLIHYAKERSK